MTWNHRVMHSKDEKHGEDSFTIREVFYDDDGKTITGWTQEAIEPMGETLDGLKLTLNRMLEACALPVLEEKELNDTVDGSRA